MSTWMYLIQTLTSKHTIVLINLLFIDLKTKKVVSMEFPEPMSRVTIIVVYVLRNILRRIAKV